MKRFVVLVLFFACSTLFVSGCKKTGNETWENMKTAGRNFNRNIDNFFGKEYDSQMIASNDQFIGPTDDEYIPLSDEDLKMQFQLSDASYPQPRRSPGEEGSGIPSLYNFQAPAGQLRTLFQTIHFDTDEHIIRNRRDLLAVQKIAQYLKEHMDIFVSIEGHCDERSTAAYNMALGTRRSNQVRALLIKNGVDYNRLYTVSYGKEKPLSLGHGEQDWKQNRRAEFKIYQK